MNYAQHVSAASTPQTEPARADQVPNHGGGYAFELDKWKQLDRFLILGAEGGTYYVGERKLTRQNAANVEACLLEDGPRAVARVVEISEAGRAPKNDPALFVLSLATLMPTAAGAAYAAFSRVARTGTHLLHLAAMVNDLRGWGPGLRRAFSRWYVEKPAEALAYQVAKYQQRDGWSHRDVLRLAHPKAPTPQHNAIFRWCVAGLEGFEKETKRGEAPFGPALPPIVIAMQQTRSLPSDKDGERQLIRLIGEHGLTHEMVPNEFKGSAEVWEALLEKMPLGAMVRQLATMTRVGLVAPASQAAATVAERLVDADRLKKSKLHPLALLAALKTYRNGRGEKGNKTWDPVSSVVDALDEAFYLAFGNVTPTNQGTFLGLDVSGSMTLGGIAGVSSLSPREACAAMALVTSRVEKRAYAMAFSNGIVPFDLGNRRRLDDVMRAMDNMPFSGTDCALPMLWATRTKNFGFDTFVIYTDNETNGSSMHPYAALQEYRRASGRKAAKLIVVGMTATKFTIADPKDPGMLDVVGFDTATPEVIGAFARGEL
jgi:60 kDa SS-A/Ro ribonucleoprotein